MLSKKFIITKVGFTVSRLSQKGDFLSIIYQCLAQGANPILFNKKD